VASRAPVPALALALAAAGAGCASALPARTVPEGARLDEGLRRSYLRALRDRSEGDGAGALRSLGPLLALRPLHLPSHILRQDLDREAGRGEAVAAEYAETARSRPGDAGAAVLAARASALPAAARVERYQAASAMDAASPWPRAALATVRAEVARELLRASEEKLRSGFPEEGGRLREEARVAAERAVTEGERAAALAPDLAPAHAALGHARAVAASVAADRDRDRRRLRSGALEALARALELDPGDPRVLLSRAVLLREMGRAAEAQPDLELAARASPRDPEVQAARARNLEDLDRREEAVEAWRAAAAAAPADPEARMDLGSALARSDRWADALEEYRRADAIYGTGGGPRWKARRGLATALTQIGIERGDPALLEEARAQLRAYDAEGGLDRDWAQMLAGVLGAVRKPPPAPPPDSSSAPGPGAPPGR
jgi:tetratricopeptide (TPR) repeat protein